MGISALILSVIGLNIYAFALVFVRSWLYKQPVYRPMLWNIWLSVLPVFVLTIGILIALFTLAATNGLGVIGQLIGWLVMGLALLAWLLLLPNSAYLITELNLNHRVEEETTPLWYDIISVLALAMSGVVNMVVNLFLVTLIFVAFFYKDISGVHALGTTLFGATLILLVSFGVYLGRYLRFNSWDIRHPSGMWHKAREHFGQPRATRDCVVFVLTHSIFFGLIYGCIAVPVLQLLEYADSLQKALR